MGSPGGHGYFVEHPQHRVTLSPFSIQRTEVTVAAYGECVRRGVCAAPDATAICNWGVPGREQHPVNCVDWDQALSFCVFAGGRLPTEAEWEYAARGADGREYPWGNGPPDDERLRWSGTTEVDGTSPVGAHPSGVSPFGLEDMAGNVWEWTSDWYGPYAAGDVTDPHGASSGEYRVSRGGTWTGSQPDLVRATIRSAHGPAERTNDQGFRCARGA